MFSIPQDVFIGREAELLALDEALLSSTPNPKFATVCAIVGPAGVGKSYLVERFARRHAEQFPGGYVRVSLAQSELRGYRELLVDLSDQLGLRPGDLDPAKLVRSRLQAPKMLLHLDDVDIRSAATSVTAMARYLEGCTIIMSGRFQSLGSAAGWRQIALQPFSEAHALAQLEAQGLAPGNENERGTQRQLVAMVGGLPLLIRLAAGQLRTGVPIEQLLKQGHARISVGTEPGADSTAISLRGGIDVALKQLRDELGTDGERLSEGLMVLGYAPSGGVGWSFAESMTALPTSDLEKLVTVAARLGLVEIASLKEREAIRIHAAIGESLRNEVERTVAVKRMTAWFVARLPELHPGQEEQQGILWREVQTETETLVEWLQHVAQEDFSKVQEVGSSYAQVNGPFAAWIKFCERALDATEEPEARSRFLWTLGNVAKYAGSIDRCMSSAQEMIALADARGNERDKALALTLIADVKMLKEEPSEAILFRLEQVLPRLKDNDRRGALVVLTRIAELLGTMGRNDEALDILNKLAPAFKQIGGVRERMAALKHAADIYERLGKIRESHRILQEEVLPIAEKMGDVRSKAVVLADIARFEHFHGNFKKALSIYREEVLPTFTLINDVHGRAVTLGRIADILQQCGEFDEALQISREQELPVYMATGDMRAQRTVLIRMANILRKQGKPQEALRIYREEVLQSDDGSHDNLWIAKVNYGMAEAYSATGNMDDALINYRAAADLYAKAGNNHQWAVAMGSVADTHVQLGNTDGALQIYQDARVKEALESAGDARSQISITAKLANILLLNGQAEEAKLIYESDVLPFLNGTGDVRTRAAVRAEIARSIVSIGQTERGLEMYRQDVLPIIDKLGTMLEKSLLRDRIAAVLKLRGELDEAERIYRVEVIPALQEQGNMSALAQSVHQLVGITQARGEFADGVRICREAMAPWFEKTADRRGRVLGLRVLAGAEQAHDNLTEAQRILDEVLGLAAPRERALALGQLASIHLAWGELDEALRACLEQLATQEIRNDIAIYTAALLGLVRIRLARWEFSEARRILEEEILPAYSRTGFIRERAGALGMLSDIYLAQGELDHALRLARDEELPRFQNIGDAIGLIAARRRVARILRRRNLPGNREEANRILVLAYDEAERMRLYERHAIRRLLNSFSLERVSIKNFKNIGAIELSLNNDSDLSGRWTCIAGVNGSGKSAVLQAITLALLGPVEAVQLGKSRLEGFRHRMDGNANDAQIDVNLLIGSKPVRVTLPISEKGTLDGLSLSSIAAYKNMMDIWDERDRDCMFLAYGPGRNLSEHISGRYQDMSADAQRIVTLFDPLVEVSNAELLLKQGKMPAAVLATLKRLLVLLFRDTSLAVTSERGALRFRMNGATMAPSDLPDGFRATIVWLADLCANWHAKAPDEARNRDPTCIRAIVLIDEIDLYLHPKLQRLLIPYLRRALPEVQWVVTTHSPLVLASFDSRELIILDADSPGGVRALDRQILGFSTNEVYEYLMETEPSSSVLDDRLPDERLALLLSQSPKVNEQKAQAGENLRRKLIERMRLRDARKPQS